MKKLPKQIIWSEDYHFHGAGLKEISSLVFDKLLVEELKAGNLALAP
jgi:hypothetical protein